MLYRFCVRHNIHKLRENPTVRNAYYTTMYWSQALLIYMGPCILLVLFTFLLIRTMKEAQERHSVLTEKFTVQSHASGQSSTGRRRSLATKQTTRMLVTVIVIFLLTEIPTGVIFLVQVFRIQMRLHIDLYNMNVLLLFR